MTASAPALPHVGPQWKATGLGYFSDQPALARFRQVYAEGMALLPEPNRTVDISTGLGRVRAYRFGDDPRPPLVLLPGRQSSTPLWRANLPGLIQHRTVWALDLLGEPGLSVQEKPITDSADQAAWLTELLSGLGLDRVHLLGVSIGGWSAINLAIRAPAAVVSVVAVDPPQTFSRISLKMIIVSLGSVLPFMPIRLRSKLLSWISGGVPSSQDLMEGRLVAAGMREFRSTLPVPKRPTAAEIGDISAPVLAIMAGRSIVHDPGATAASARRLLTHGTVEIWPQASHALHGEFPGELGARVHRFIGEVEAATA